MVVMTAKFSKKKRLVFAAALLALIVLVVLCAKSGGSAASDAGPTGNDERLAFLSSFGYTVCGEPAEAGDVVVPAQGGEVFDRYNELQRSQGYDLSQFAGQTVNRFVYALENYDETGELWYATVLQKDGEIIGGDVASCAPGGRVHGFARPAGH